MQRIRITVPATLTGLGPGLAGLALAVRLNASLEFSARDDNELQLQVTGDDKAQANLKLRHPAIRAAVRVFQHQEHAPAGFSVQVNSQIPVGKGLGAETAFVVAGILGANNLLNANLPRDTLLLLAAQTASAGEGVTAAMLGGLASGVLHEQRLYYRVLASFAGQVVIVLPEIKRYARRAERAHPKNVAYADVLHNIRRLPLLVDAFQRMDFDALAVLLSDKVLTDRLTKLIPGCEAAVTAGKQAGAAAVTVSGNGPALVAFAPDHHHAIADTMREAFAQADVSARTWVLPVERQGVSVSLTQTAQ